MFIYHIKIYFILCWWIYIVKKKKCHKLICSLVFEGKTIDSGLSAHNQSLEALARISLVSIAIKERDHNEVYEVKALSYVDNPMSWFKNNC